VIRVRWVEQQDRRHFFWKELRERELVLAAKRVPDKQVGRTYTERVQDLAKLACDDARTAQSFRCWAT
jgi:hypothetical protein